MSIREKQNIVIFRNKHEKSLLPKALIAAAMATSLCITFYRTFVAENELVTMVANSIKLLIVPGSMALIFILILIPLKEMYLKEKYGDAYNEYESKTKKLIPFIY